MAQLHYVVAEADLKSLAGEWETLLDDSDAVGIFTRPSWLRIWLHAFEDRRDLLILTVRAEGRLCGVAAFLVDGELLRLAGDPEVWDYADMPSRRGHERGVLDALLAYLAEKGWNRIDLWGLAEDSPTCHELSGAAERQGYRLEAERESVCPTIDLPADWDAYLGMLNKKDRHELRRKIRRFEETDGPATLVALTGVDEVEAALPDFFRLHVQSREDKAEFMTPVMRHFFEHAAEETAREGGLRLYFMERADKRLASVLCFDGGDSLMLYNSGYDPEFAGVSVGLVSKALCVQQAIADGKKRLNFLRGPERYKYDLGARDAGVYRCTLQREGN